VQRALQGRQGATVVPSEDVIDFIDKLLAQSDETPALGTLLALDIAADAPAAGAAAGAPVKEKKKRKPKFSPGKYTDVVLYLFLQKQNLGAKIHIYLEEGKYPKRLFRGPSTNDMKK